MYSSHEPIGPQPYPLIYVVANPVVVRGLLDRKRSEDYLIYNAACRESHHSRKALQELVVISIDVQVIRNRLFFAMHSLLPLILQRYSLCSLFTVVHMCACVCCHPIYSGRRGCGRTSRGHTGFLIHVPSVVLALIFLARRIQPFLSLVDREVDFLCTNDFIVLHVYVGLFFFFVGEENPSSCDYTGIRTHVPTCQKVSRLPTEPPEQPSFYMLVMNGHHM